LLEAVYYYRSGEFTKATPLIKEALEIAKEKGYKDFEGLGYLYLSRNQRRMGLLDKAIENALVALQIFESQEDQLNLMLGNSHLGMLYQETGSPEVAIGMHLENIALSKNDPSSGAKARYYFDLGNAYMKAKDYKNAETYFLEAVTISQESNFVPGEMIMLSTLGQLYKATGELDKAKENFNRVLPYFEKTGQFANIAAIYYDLATISSLENEHKASIPLYNKSLNIYKKIENLIYIRDINQKLFIAYNINQDYERAQAANKVYNAINDSINSKEQKEMIADMKTKYETDKIALQGQVAEAESLRNRNYFIGAIIIAGLILLASLFFFGKLREKKKAELVTIELRETQKRLALEKQYRESELKALKSQMNPHFIFNALNSIQEYIVMNKKNEASDYLGKFADLIRTYLSHSDTGIISLQEEIDSLNMYLDLESLRFEETLHYTLNAAQELNKDVIHIPTMLIQPYIENALKHGLLHKKEDRELEVSFNASEGKNIECIVKDNRVGRVKAKEIQEKKSGLHRSFAAKATEERLSLLNYGKEKKIGVEIIDLFDEDKTALGTKVILSIPITAQ